MTVAYAQDGALVRAVLLTGLESLVFEAGGDLRALMVECGLPLDALRKHDLLISYRRYCALLELVALRCDLPHLGIDWTLAMAPHHANFAPLVALAHNSATLAEWYADARQYWATHNNALYIAFEPEVRPGISLLCERNQFESPRARHASEKVIASLVAILRVGIGQPDFAPERVRFCHGQPRDIAQHQAFFRCPIEFGCESDGIEVPTTFFETSTVGANSPMRRVVRRYVQHRVDAMEVYDASFATHVSLIVGSLIGTNNTDIGTTAHILDISAKKLQRLLAAEGTTYSAVVEDLRRKIAQDLLVESAAPISLIAAFLGYSGNAVFSVAFRKWTGMTPSNWRQHRQQMRGRPPAA